MTPEDFTREIAVQKTREVELKADLWDAETALTYGADGAQARLAEKKAALYDVQQALLHLEAFLEVAQRPAAPAPTARRRAEG